MVIILLETAKGKGKRIQLKKVISICFVILLISIVGLLSYLWINEKTSIFKATNQQEYEKVKDYKYTKINDKNNSSQYEWMLGEITGRDTCVSFISVYQYIEVYIDDELIYSVKPEKSKMMTSKVGRNWVIIPLGMNDSYKQLRVKFIQAYDRKKNRDVEFLMGSRRQIIDDVIKADLPCIILGIAAIVIGVLFCVISLYVLIKKKKWTKLIYISILALLTGFWRLFETNVSLMIFQYNQGVTELIVFYSDMLLGIPCILFIQNSFRKRYVILDIICIINILNGFIMTILQPFTIINTKENIIINNIILLVSAITSVIFSIKELKHEKHDKIKKITLTCVIMCCISAVTDIALYYIKGTSSGLIISTASFLVYFVILGVMAVCDLNKRAERDMHTGLYNKSECIRILKNKNIINETTALIMFDLNNLKFINDTYGHDTGDKFIYDFSQIILECIPMRAFAGRFGGDEFIIIINRTNEVKIRQILNEMDILADQYNCENTKVKISYSYGYALSTDFEECTMQTLAKKADYNMYMNKKKYHQALKEL